MSTSSSQFESSDFQSTITHITSSNHSVDNPLSTVQSTVTDITPGLSPTCVVYHSVDYSISTVPSTITEVTSTLMLTPTVGNYPLSTVAPPANTFQSSGSDTPIVSNVSTLPSTSAAHYSKILTSPLSNFLVQYVAQLPEKRAAPSTRVTGARVLTSAEGYQILREKEEKRRKRRKKKARKA